MTKLWSTTSRLAAGGGAFALPRLTIGVFHSDQPTHRLSVGSDRRRLSPLLKDQGWILPAQSEGLCEYDSELNLTTVSVDAVLLRDVGLDATDLRLQRVGLLDPLILQFAATFQSIANADRLYRQTMEQAFAAHLAQTLRQKRPEVVGIDDGRLRRAVEFIHDHLAQDMALDDLADVAAMSPFHFARAFKAATGASPLQYIIAARIELARLKLRSTGLSVAQVAHDVGYEDISRFGQHFKARVGVTPAAWRAG